MTNKMLSIAIFWYGKSTCWQNHPGSIWDYTLVTPDLSQRCPLCLLDISAPTAVLPHGWHNAELGRNLVSKMTAVFRGKGKSHYLEKNHCDVHNSQWGRLSPNAGSTESCCAWLRPIRDLSQGFDSHLPSLTIIVTALMCIAGHHSLARSRQFRTFSVSYLFI